MNKQWVTRLNGETVRTFMNSAGKLGYDYIILLSIYYFVECKETFTLYIKVKYFIFSFFKWSLPLPDFSIYLLFFFIVNSISFNKI